MRFVDIALILTLLGSLSACEKFISYNGPEVTQIIVNKGERRMRLMHHGKVLEEYNIGLGFAPVGDKEIEGDGKTPEGRYVIDRRNPNSQFYLSLGISYPDAKDRAEARALGKSPGGDIFIHGRPRIYRMGGRDWTAGCIAVTNREMRKIYAMVRKGTPIVITP